MNAAPQYTMSTAAAKARLSAVISSVEADHEPITILRRGIPVAQITPIETKRQALFGSMRGTVTKLGDIISPTGAEWTIGDAIDRAIPSIVWERAEARKSIKLYLQRDAVPADRSRWPEQHAWMLQVGNRFHQTFEPLARLMK